MGAQAPAGGLRELNVRCAVPALDAVAVARASVVRPASSEARSLAPAGTFLIVAVTRLAERLNAFIVSDEERSEKCFLGGGVVPSWWSWRGRRCRRGAERGGHGLIRRHRHGAARAPAAPSARPAVERSGAMRLAEANDLAVVDERRADRAAVDRGARPDDRPRATAGLHDRQRERIAEHAHREQVLAERRPGGDDPPVGEQGEIAGVGSIVPVNFAAPPDPNVGSSAPFTAPVPPLGDRRHTSATGLEPTRWKPATRILPSGWSATPSAAAVVLPR